MTAKYDLMPLDLVPRLEHIEVEKLTIRGVHRACVGKATCISSAARIRSISKGELDILAHHHIWDRYVLISRRQG